jgi:hypothetical protein
MKPRILGYAVLVYAALTSDVLGLVGFILKPGSDGWWTLGGAVLWLAYVSGGFGLIFGRTWSRMLLLVASAGSMIEIIAGVVVLLRSGLPLSDIAPAALWTLPQVAISVAIFVGALKLRLPEARKIQPSPAPVARKAASPGLNLAYGCFSWIAFVLLRNPTPFASTA